MSEKSIRETQLIVLKKIAEFGTCLIGDLNKSLEVEFNVRSTVTALQKLKYVSAKPANVQGPGGNHAKLYFVNKSGQTVLDNLDKYNVVPFKRYKSSFVDMKQSLKKSPPLTVQDSFPMPAPALNVSATAEQLMDNISGVIQQNAHYRDSMERIGHEIAKMLGMKLVKREPLENEAE